MPLNKSTNQKLTCKAKDIPEGVKCEPKRPHEVEEQPAKQSTRHAMINNIHPNKHTTQLSHKVLMKNTLPPQPFYGPFSGTTRVSRCQKRTSGLYGVRED